MGMRTTRRWTATALAAALGGAAVSPSWADGDEFFAFRSKLFNENGARAEVDIGFVGSVKDEAGARLADAVITVAVNVETENGVQRVTFDSYTDLLGRYRTLDAAGAAADLLGIEVYLLPEDVELIGVEKEGYVQVRRFQRGTSGKETIQEVDFIMRPAK